MSAANETVVGPLEAIDDGGVVGVDVGSRRVAVVRIGDAVYAIGDVCTHQDVSLSEGEVNVDECTLECPKHGSEFSLVNGDALSLPATKPVAVFDAEVVDGMVVVRERTATDEEMAS